MSVTAGPGPCVQCGQYSVVPEGGDRRLVEERSVRNLTVTAGTDYTLSVQKEGSLGDYRLRWTVKDGKLKGEDVALGLQLIGVVPLLLRPAAPAAAVHRHFAHTALQLVFALPLGAVQDGLHLAQIGFQLCAQKAGERASALIHHPGDIVRAARHQDVGVGGMVVAKADRDLHAKLLLKIGADEVVFPERDMAQRTAMRFSVNGALE